MGKFNETVDDLVQRTKLSRETVFHLVCGLIGVLVLLFTVALAKGSLGFAVIVFSVVFGVGVEWYQHVRSEGDSSWLDAIKTAAPGVLIGVVLLLFKVASLSLPGVGNGVVPLT